MEGFQFPCGQRSEMLCGCTIEPFSDVMRLNLCPLHAAAPDLRDALRLADSVFSSLADSDPELAADTNFDQAWDAVLTSLGRAKGVA